MSECTSCKDCVLIDLDCIYSITPLSESIDTNEISTSLKKAQDLRIKDLLVDCFETLCTKVQEARDTLKADNDPEGKNFEDFLSDPWKEIVSSSKESLAWFAYHYWLKDFGGSKPKKKGMSKAEEPIEADELRSKVRGAEEDGERYLETLKKLLKNKTFLKTHKAELDCLNEDCDHDHEDDCEPHNELPSFSVV